MERRITKTTDVVEVLEPKHVLCLNKGFIALYLGKGEMGLKKCTQRKWQLQPVDDSSL